MPESDRHLWLQGQWFGGTTSVEFDWNGGMITSMVNGTYKKKPLALVRVFGNAITFLSGEKELTAYIQNSGDIIIMSSGKKGRSLLRKVR